MDMYLLKPEPFNQAVL